MLSSSPSPGRGLLVSFEGPEGAGKSTVAAAVGDQLTRDGFEVVATREPGGTFLGRSLRQVLLEAAGPDSPHELLDDRAELLLFLADRAQHVAEVILPALERGCLVLCDRFVHSTLAYQGFGRGLDLQQLGFLNRFATGGLQPDLVALVDIDPALGRARVLGRGRPDRIEAAGELFHQRVRHGLLSLAMSDPDRFVVVDGANPVAESAATIIAAITAAAGR